MKGVHNEHRDFQFQERQFSIQKRRRDDEAITLFSGHYHGHCFAT